MASADPREPAAAPVPAGPGRRDLVVAGVTALVSIGLLTSLPAIDASDPGSLPLDAPMAGAPSWWLVLVTLLAQAAALLPARRRPGTVLVTVAALGVVPAATAGDVAGLTALAVGVAVVLLVLAVPPTRRWPALVAGAVLVATASATTATTVGTPDASAVGQGLLQAVGTVALPLLVTLLVRSRRDVRTARRAEREAQVDATLSRERAAMARELHDIAAHHLSGIALMAGVVDRQIDTDPQAAHTGVRQVRDQSTAVLDDLRRLVGLLRDDTSEGRSVETFATIPALVAAAPIGATYAVLHADGEGPVGVGVGPLAQLAAYRAVQEALTNAGRHAAGAPCTVQVDDRSPDRVTVTVHNDAPGRSGPARPADRTTAGGFGLVGMRERAELVGADLAAGPTADGGWDVRLVVPRDGATP